MTSKSSFKKLFKPFLSGFLTAGTSFISLSFKILLDFSLLNQLPFLSTAIGYILYLLLSAKLYTDLADINDTSCSSDLPPKRIPNLNLFKNYHLLLTLEII